MTRDTIHPARGMVAILALLAVAGMAFFALAGVAAAKKPSVKHRAHARMHVSKNKRTAMRSFLHTASLPAGVTVCNEAQSSPRGTWDATASTDPLPPARHKSTAMPVGHGGGLINAAANSPALAVCTPTVPDDGGGGTT